MDNPTQTLDIPYMVGGVYDAETGIAWATDGKAAWRMHWVTYRSRQIQRAVNEWTADDPPFLAKATKRTEAPCHVVDMAPRCLPGLLDEARKTWNLDLPWTRVGRVAPAVLYRGASDADYTVAIKIGKAFVAETYHPLLFERKAFAENEGAPVIVYESDDTLMAIVSPMLLDIPTSNRKD